MKLSQGKTNTIWYHLYVESKKHDTKELIYKTGRDSQTKKINVRLPKGKDEMDKLGVWDQRIHTTICKIDKQQGPTYTTGNHTQYLIITYANAMLSRLSRVWLRATP